MASKSIPTTAEAVIIGGGVMGASTCYHLAKAGMTDLVMLERTEHYEDSATNRCAGGVRYQFSTEVNVRLSQVSLPMLERFKDELGVDPQYEQCGYLLVATNKRDEQIFRSNIELQNRLGVSSQWLTSQQVQDLVPQMRFEDALGGSFHQKDGLADPGSVLLGYHQNARRLGVTLATGVTVTDILSQAGRVTGVQTDLGTIEAPIVVNATGPWAGEVGRMAGVDIPIKPLRRQMITTTPLPELDPQMPFVVDFAQ